MKAEYDQVFWIKEIYSKMGEISVLGESRECGNISLSAHPLECL